MHKFFTAASLLALMAPGSDSHGAGQAPDIFHAAPDQLTEVWHSERHQLIQLRLDPGESIPDHRSGPRIIVPLNDLHLERIDSGERLDIDADAGSWLTNRLSRGVRNVGDQPAEYLALLFPPSNYPPVDDDSQGNCSVLGGQVINMVHRPYAGACKAHASGDEIMRVDKWRLVYFETDALMCQGDDCHHCAAGAALYLHKGVSIRSADGGRAAIVLFRF